MNASQLPLFPFRKPLLDLLGADFFKRVPASPGVYIFLSAERKVLYVGQSKDLRSRLAFYKNARPDRDPRRILRMINRARSIELETCPCADQAQSRETELILKHRPTYNRAQNGDPRHPYFVLRTSGSLLELSLTDEPPDGSRVYGAFKGRGRARRALHAIVRLLWMASQEKAGVWDLPVQLHPNTRALEFCLPPLPRAIPGGDLMEAFLLGEADGLTGLLAPKVAQLEDVYLRAILENDLVVLEEFFEAGPRWNKEIARTAGLPLPIPSGELDSLRSRFRSSRKTRRGETGSDAA